MGLKELRARVKAALERMEAAHKALDEAGDDADLDNLTKEFDEAETEHRTATDALAKGEQAEERTKRVAEARRNAPIDPVDAGDGEDDDDPDDGEGEGESEGRTRARVRREPLTYERGNGHSAFADLARLKIEGDEESRKRILQHHREMKVEERAHPSQKVGEGGEFIAPIWMQDEWIKLPRAGRAVADSLNRKPFPNSNTINIPKLATGTATERQGEDGAAVKSQDVTTTSVTGTAQTIAGQEDVSMQLVDLSNPGMDEILFDDLGRDYNQKVDLLCISSSVTNAKGLLEVSGTNGVTYTDTTPTVPEIYPKFAKAIAEVNTGIFRPPTVIAMHPRRWAWIMSALDSSNRPLVTPYSPQNAVARLDRVAAEATVGNLQGLDVIIDANLPINEGAGTNQDSILVYSAEDLYLFEDDTPRLRVLNEVLSGTLQVRFQIYNYVILIAGRLPRAISKIQGTGLVEPTF